MNKNHTYVREDVEKLICARIRRLDADELTKVFNSLFSGILSTDGDKFLHTYNLVKLPLARKTAVAELIARK
jgi:hypothetical protein